MCGLFERGGFTVVLRDYLNCIKSRDGEFQDLQTPLHISSARGFEEITNLLLDYGAKVNLTDTVSISTNTHRFIYFYLLLDKQILNVKLYIFSYPSVITYVLGAQKNHLNEMVLLSTYNICFGREIRKLIFVTLS